MKFSPSKNEEPRAFFWDLTTGNLRALPCSASICEAFCIERLIVLLWFYGNHELFGTVYKVQDESDAGFVCIADREPLHAWAQTVRSARDLDCFAMCVMKLETPSDDLSLNLEMRSKNDFSLVRTVTVRDGQLVPLLLRSRNSFVFSECFAFVFKSEEINFIDVVSLVDDDFRTVHRFCVPKEMMHRHVTVVGQPMVVGRFLIFDCSYADGIYSAFWKLPVDFVETCRRHLNEGTVGMTRQCDQLIVEKPRDGKSHSYNYKSCLKFDRFGFLKCHVNRKEPATVVHVAMLDSIISDEAPFI